MVSIVLENQGSVRINSAGRSLPYGTPHAKPCFPDASVGPPKRVANHDHRSQPQHTGGPKPPPVAPGESNNLDGIDMTDIKLLIQRLEDEGNVMFWQGKASKESIEKLESLLGSRLPVSFKTFLAECGGGGFDDADALICGIENDDPSLEHRGTVYGDTLLCREDYSLPENLVVIYLGVDDVVWCLDVSQFDGDECPVVTFDVVSRSTKPLAGTFNNFLVEYLTLRITG